MAHVDRWEAEDKATLAKHQPATLTEEDYESPDLPEEMLQAAKFSLTHNSCMFCGNPGDLADAEDWDGNKGRACATCRSEYYE